jgi:hypothetical protein
MLQNIKDPRLKERFLNAVLKRKLDESA